MTGGEKKQASLASYFGAAPKRPTPNKAPAASDKPSDDAGAAQDTKAAARPAAAGDGGTEQPFKRLRRATDVAPEAAAAAAPPPPPPPDDSKDERSPPQLHQQQPAADLEDDMDEDAGEAAAPSRPARTARVVKLDDDDEDEDEGGGKGKAAPSPAAKKGAVSGGAAAAAGGDKNKGKEEEEGGAEDAAAAAAKRAATNKAAAGAFGALFAKGKAQQQQRQQQQKKGASSPPSAKKAAAAAAAAPPSPSAKKPSPAKKQEPEEGEEEAAPQKKQQQQQQRPASDEAATADGDEEDDEVQEEAAAAPQPPPMKKPASAAAAALPTQKKKGSGSGGGASGAAAAAAEGVGTGALEAAASQAQIDVPALCRKYGLSEPPKKKKGAAAAPKQEAGGGGGGGGGSGGGHPVPYAALVDVFEDVASTTKRLEILALATGLFRAVLRSRPEDLLPTVYLCTNRVAPPHEGAELGVGDAILAKALGQVTGRKDSAVKAEFEKAGDWGVVAVQSRATQGLMFKPAPLTVPGVFKALGEIARTSGAASQDRKKGAIARLLVAAKGAEAGYLLRTLAGRLRIGLAEKSVLTALAHATLLHKEGVGLEEDDEEEDEEEQEQQEQEQDDGGEAAGGGKKPAAAAASTLAKEEKNRRRRRRSKIDTAALADRLAAADAAVRRAYSRCPSLDVLIPALVGHPLSELDERAPFTPGVPVGPMLAKPTTGVREVLDKFSGRDFTCEYKYDGERVQIHVLEGGKRVRVFSRNSEDTTGKFPDIAARCASWLAPGVDSVVIDGEAVAWDPRQRRILPFQQLSTRARKDVSAADVKVAVVVYAFDCLYLDGRVLLDAPLTERREALRAALAPKEGELAFAHATVSADVDELARFLDDAVAASTEGLIVKTLKDPYTPAQRASCWLKLKKDYLDGCGDTFDVVPVGAYSGKGKRAGVYGAYLLAVYDEDTERFQTISKLGTGFSEEQLAALDAELRPGALAERPVCVEAPRQPGGGGGDGNGGDGNGGGGPSAAQPDVWFVPSVVWEVKAADLSISPVHRAAAGLVHPDRGVSIRFPRLLRRREDKKPEQATTSAQVAEMYRAQAAVVAAAQAAAGGAAGGDGGDGGDDGAEE